MVKDGVELVYKLQETKLNLIPTVMCDGYNASLMKENLSATKGVNVANKILSNSIKAASFLANPKIDDNRSKILCLGKVQSGKTAFFISSIALAFDNGYDLCILFGGTKNTLLEQNEKRLKSEFNNNKDVKIHSLNNGDYSRISDDIKKGYKVILLVLKNVTSKTANLYTANDLSKYFRNIPTLIIDDESDEYTPGAPNLKKRNPKAGITHDVISELFNSFKIASLMFITATPQANLLLSTIDDLSPDYAVLVQPGEDYTGGQAFHDSMENNHVKVISDTDDFILSIPNSFNEALYYFMLGIGIMRLKKNHDRLSMLIHPSHLKKIHKNIVEKIKTELESTINILSDSTNVYYESYVKEFDKIYASEFTQEYSFEEILFEVKESLKYFKVLEFNTSKSGQSDIVESKEIDQYNYNIFVGGNMLGRGVTIPNLIVTYIYRDSKRSAIDTLYQRARWFGYKKKYFDICRVYMTYKLKEKFVAITDSERDLWTAMSEFLETDIDFKEFKRVFSLSNDNLILTRSTVSKTVVLERTKSGYTYDKSILFSKEDVISNRKLVDRLLTLYKDVGYEKKFISGDSQTHFIIEDRYTKLYQEFIEHYKFQSNSKLGPNSFSKLINKINEKLYEDRLTIIVMRYQTGEYRSLTMQGNAIKELPQGYDNGTGYSGDKNLDGFMSHMQMQIHLVYTDKSNLEMIPILAFNNPLTSHSIRYVTGDKYEN